MFTYLLICLPCRTCAEILLTTDAFLSLFPLSLECIWRHLLTLQVIGSLLLLLLLSLFRLSILIHPGQGSQLRYCNLHTVVFLFSCVPTLVFIFCFSFQSFCLLGVWGKWGFYVNVNVAFPWVWCDCVFLDCFFYCCLSWFYGLGFHLLHIS